MYACEYASVSLKKDSRLKTRTVGYYFDETKNIYLTFILLVSSVILIKSQYSIKILFFFQFILLVNIISKIPSKPFALFS